MAVTLKKILDFLVYSNIYLSFGASVVALTTIFIMKLPLSFELLFIPFAGGMLIYNTNRHTDKLEDKINVQDRVGFVEKYGNYILGASSILYLIALYFAFIKGVAVLLVTLLPVIIASFYSIKRLKKIYILKNLLVGLSWGVTPLLVGFYNGIFSIAFISLSLFFAITFFINTIIFDIKDIIGDSNLKIMTMPIKLGLEKTKNICYASNFVAVFLLLISVLFEVLPLSSLILLPFIAYIFFYIYRAEERKDGFFYGVIVDGEFIFLFFIILVLNILQI
jgi:4-hydroxybenzoate polyprenyltransferase